MLKLRCQSTERFEELRCRQLGQLGSDLQQLFTFHLHHERSWHYILTCSLFSPHFILAFFFKKRNCFATTKGGRLVTEKILAVRQALLIASFIVCVCGTERKSSYELNDGE